MKTVLLLTAFLNYVNVCWIAVSKVRGCDVLRVTGTNDSSLSGIYVKQYDVTNTTTAKSRSDYVQQNGHYTICAVSKVRWIVTSDSSCNVAGARVYVDDVSRYPDRVAGPWQECIPDERSGRCWRKAPSIVVSCHECQRLRLVNVTMSNNLRYVGDYIKANFTCHQRYVYYRSSMYIIYWANQWRIHDNKEACGKQSGDLKVKVPLNHIRHINVDNGSWTEWNGSHYVRSTARLICLGYSDSVELDNQRNDPKIESECRRLRLINVNASNNVRYVGDYVKANITCHNKYVYSKSETYIVFWAGHWRVHDDRSPCETKSGDVRVRPAIRKLPYINPDDSSWTEWNGTEYIPSSARLICIEYVDATKFLMKEDIKDNGPAIWIFCVAAAAGVIIIIIISVIVVIILRKRRKHSDHRVAAPISYNNKVLTQDQDYDPDGLIIIDNAIYSQYYSSV